MKTSLQSIPLSQIKGNNLARSKRSPQAQEALNDSVKRLGVLQPVIVVKKGDIYILIAGFGRIQAALAAGLVEIQAVVIEGDVTPADALILAHNENNVRSNVPFLDIADAIERIVKAKKITEGEAGELLGIKQSVTSKILASNSRLTEKVKLKLSEQKQIGYSVGYVLSQAAPERQEELLDSYLKEGWSRDRLEKEVKQKPERSFTLTVGEGTVKLAKEMGYEKAKAFFKKMHDELSRLERQGLPFDVVPRMLGGDA